MSLVVTDTLEDERVEFTADGDVTLYVCGLTVSDDPHLGHARLWFHADVLHRWLDHLGYDVRHVENVTARPASASATTGPPSATWPRRSPPPPSTRCAD
jgi:cysteinyl-tRNA synthetase